MPVSQQTMADESHMNTLSVLHYVLAGFGLLGMVFLGIHAAFMLTFFSMAPPVSSSPVAATATSPPVATPLTGPETLPAEFPEATAPQTEIQVAGTPSTPALSPAAPTGFPKQIKWVMGAFYLFFAILIIAYMVCNILSAKWLKQRKNRTFSYIVAAMNCLQFPFGTALGVFTFIVLSRPTVGSSYEVHRQV